MNVTVIDYGVGNLLSVSRAFEYCGAKVNISSHPLEIENSERLILPGVGAFKDAMCSLEKRDLIEPIKEFVSTGRPFLGICLGMQMLFDSSEEFGFHAGLSFVSGKVVAIPKQAIHGHQQKIPNISWCELHAKNRWKGSIFDNIKDGEAVYFIHSFEAIPMDKKNILAVYNFGGREIVAAVKHNNVYGCQFHPEKSGTVGLKIISSFLAL